jgi:hypothetical protein
LDKFANLQIEGAKKLEEYATGNIGADSLSKLCAKLASQFDGDTRQ